MSDNGEQPVFDEQTDRCPRCGQRAGWEDMNLGDWRFCLACEEASTNAEIAAYRYWGDETPG